MSDPYQVVRDFESALCEYTGARYAVTTTSCTMALLLACRYQYLYEPYGGEVTVPARTYVGVPMSVIHAGFTVAFREWGWVGNYDLNPLPIVDSARYLNSSMYDDWQHDDYELFICVSFHPTKHLGISTGGGAILHNNHEADKILRMMRFDGRQERVAPRSQKDWVMGYHAAMSPVTAAEGLLRLSTLPKHNDPIPWDDYPDLSKMEIFK